MSNPEIYKYDIHYILKVGDQEYPRYITLESASKYAAKQSLFRKVNKEQIDELIIVSVKKQ